MTLPSSASRAWGFLFLVSKLALASGSPWYDALGLDPIWLFETAADSRGASPPVAGIAVRSRSALALRNPLRARWEETEIVETFSWSVPTGPIRWSNWARTSFARESRPLAVSDFSLDADAGRACWSAGTRLTGDGFEAKLGGEQGTDRIGFSGAVLLAIAKSRLEIGLARIQRKSAMEISTGQGDLSMGWNDVADSAGASLAIPLGVGEGRGGVWGRETASHGTPDLAAMGSASGWSLGLRSPTRSGTWSLAYSREHTALRTLGSREGRVFHDQDWRSVRVGIDASWEGGSWRLSGSTRQLRLDIPYSGLERPFVHWNMIPKDAFGRIAGVLEDRSEYLDGSFRVESWNLLLQRAWSWKSFSVNPGIGASWTGFEALLEGSTLEVRGLFPTMDESTLCDGSGWIAMADLRVELEWRPTGLGTIRAESLWRQPLAGRWSSRLPGAVEASASKTGNRAVDPLGFHQASLEWMLAW